MCGVVGLQVRASEMRQAYSLKAPGCSWGCEGCAGCAFECASTLAGEVRVRGVGWRGQIDE